MNKYVVITLLLLSASLRADVTAVESARSARLTIEKYPFVVVLCTTERRFLEGISWEFARASNRNLFRRAGVQFIHVVAQDKARKKLINEWGVTQMPAILLFYNGELDEYQDGEKAIVDDNLTERSIVNFILDFWQQDLEQYIKSRPRRRVYKRVTTPQSQGYFRVGTGYPYYWSGYYPDYPWYSPYTYYGSPYTYPYEYYPNYGGVSFGVGF